ncbi:MAG TPA: hypothetical protein ENJ32_09340 [Crenotrichaceae bacterium]|nr:hypothetical protein [Crenotrichaceae bacterium]
MRIVKHNKRIVNLLALLLLCSQSLVAASRHHRPQNDQHAQSWYDWAQLVRVDVETNLERIPYSPSDCAQNSYNSGYPLTNNNPLGVSDAVRYHLEQAEGRRFSGQHLTPKQRYQQQRQSQQPHYQYNNCEPNWIGQRVRYYRICYLYRGREYYATLNYYPKRMIRVQVTAFPVSSPRYNDPVAYQYRVVPAVNRY